jgi:hypothetical protein
VQWAPRQKNWLANRSREDIPEAAHLRSLRRGYGGQSPAEVGGAEGKHFQLSFDTLELARKFTELKYSLDCIILLLNSQVDEKKKLIL